MHEESLHERIDLFKQTFERSFRSEQSKIFSFRSAILKEHDTKIKLFSTIQSLQKASLEPILLGQTVAKVANKHLNSIGARPSRILSELKNNYKDYYDEFYKIIGDALLSEEKEEFVFAKTHEKIMNFHGLEKGVTNVHSTLYHLLTVTLACKKNSSTIFGMVKFFGDVTEFFLKKRMFGFYDKNIEVSFRELNKLVQYLFAKMKNEWKWDVYDLFDVQSALWMTFHSEEKLIANVRLAEATSSDTSMSRKEYDKRMKNLPTETEKMNLVKQRVGQSVLRDNLLTICKGRCMLTGIENKELLRVSHIKPWKNCDDNEKLEENNCLLLSALWDLAFDRGLVTFTNDGFPEFSKKLRKSSKEQLIFSTPIVLTDKQKMYLQWHRKYVFKHPGSRS